MIVWQSTHDALRFKHMELEMKLGVTQLQLKNLQREHAKIILDNASLRSDNTSLRRQLHHEGRRFNSLAESQSPALSEADLKQLIALCHPDKHGGSKIANEITAKLIQIRKK